MYIFGLRKDRFKTPLNGIEHPILVNSKKVEGRKKYFFSGTKKKIVKKKIICEVESFTVDPYHPCQTGPLHP